MMALGVVLESVADAQKKAAKKVNKNRFVDAGVYRLVRCPNYLGELVIWTGAFVVCFGACCSVWQWVIAAILTNAVIQRLSVTKIIFFI